MYIMISPLKQQYLPQILKKIFEHLQCSILNSPLPNASCSLCQHSFRQSSVAQHLLASTALRVRDVSVSWRHACTVVVCIFYYFRRSEGHLQLDHVVRHLSLLSSTRAGLCFYFSTKKYSTNTGMYWVALFIFTCPCICTLSPLFHLLTGHKNLHTSHLVSSLFS